VSETVGTLLDFARGPLFRLTLALMVLGLARLVLLAIYGIVRTYMMAGDKRLPWPVIRERTLWTVFPFSRLGRSRTVYSVVSVLFHIGLLIVPVFLFAHIHLWQRGLGISWFALPAIVADALTIMTIVAGLVLLAMRAGSPLSRTIGRFQDYAWPILLVLVFLSGLFASHPTWCPVSYPVTLLIHVLSAEAAFVLMPFSKIAHCVLLPFSPLVSDLGWRFPATSGRDVCKALGKESTPI